MRILDLLLKEIGPFKSASLNFSKGDGEHCPITIITGENGTGKTIVLDAVRTMLAGKIVERKIFKNNLDSELKCTLEIDNKIVLGQITNINEVLKYQGYSPISAFTTPYSNHKATWIANYWTSKSKNDNFEIQNMIALNPEKYLDGALSGIESNVKVTALITYFDYLKSSDNPKEKAEGEVLFEIVKKIVKLGLNGGEFKYVERKTLTPILLQLGQDVAINQLSSGNLYLIQRMISLLGQMFSVYTLNPEIKLEDLCNTPGLLLIDEAENHLHPKWQKTFLNSILDIFPNLQIIATTHSPFIVSSVENARVYVCKSMGDHSIIEDETENYANKPIEEVLLSDVFNTDQFNSKISKLLSDRDKAIESKNKTSQRSIEQKLKELNPTYFSYYDIEDLMAQLVEK